MKVGDVILLPAKISFVDPRDHRVHYQHKGVEFSVPPEQMEAFKISVNGAEPLDIMGQKCPGDLGGWPFCHPRTD